MANGIVNIILRTFKKGSGIEEVAKDTAAKAAAEEERAGSRPKATRTWPRPRVTIKSSLRS